MLDIFRSSSAKSKGFSTLLWVIHQQAGARQALRRLCGTRAEGVIYGSPSDPRFKAGRRPDQILLGLSGDFEQELGFAEQYAHRYPDARWLLFAEPADMEDARRLFDVLPADFESWPPHPAHLARYLRRESQPRALEPLSARISHAKREDRFLRWFGDLELPGLERARDPRWRGIPILIQGEPGTGRGLMARSIHTFSSSRGEAELAHLSCQGASLDSLRRCIEIACREHPAHLTLWLDGLETLDYATQRGLIPWIEEGPPCAIPLERRWIASCSELGAWLGDAPLLPELHTTLGGIEIALPPLREQPERVVRFVQEMTRSFCEEKGLPIRSYTKGSLDYLAGDYWPGNLRELEAVILRTLSQTEADPIDRGNLAVGDSLSPLEAGVESAGSEEESAAVEAIPEPDSEAMMPPSPGMIPSPSVELADELRPLPPTAYLPEPALRRFLAAMIHEIGNPLVTLQTFVDLLPSRFDDRGFRTQFSDLVPPDARRIAAVVEQLRQFAAFGAPRPERTNLTELLDAILEEHRHSIQDRRLVVLKEFGAETILCRGEEEQLRFGLDAILRTVIGILPERGHLDIALSASADAPSAESPSILVSFRFRDSEHLAGGDTTDALCITDNTLALVMAEAIVSAHGGNTRWTRGEDGEALLEFTIPR